MTSETKDKALRSLLDTGMKRARRWSGVVAWFELFIRPLKFAGECVAYAYTVLGWIATPVVIDALVDPSSFWGIVAAVVGGWVLWWTIVSALVVAEIVS